MTADDLDPVPVGRSVGPGRGAVAGSIAVLGAVALALAVRRARSSSSAAADGRFLDAPIPDGGELAARLQRDLLSGPDGEAAATVIVPVNAQGDLDNVLKLLADLGRYQGRHRFDLTLIVNNYDPAAPPEAAARLRSLGATVIAIPNTRVPGEAPGFSARIPGARAARTDGLICFDADCRLPDPTALLDWYVDAFDAAADVAYTHVGYHGLRPHPSVRVRMLTHHGARWFKRVVLRVPTVRGSNYAIRRDLLLRLYDEGYLADDMNVGPVSRHEGARIVYSGRGDLVVLTSGRMFRGGWRSLVRYLLYRLRYNARVLRVRPDAARHTGREKDPVRRYVDDVPV